MNDLPVLGYGSQAPSSGFSGSETSEQRARTEDSVGTTKERQELVLHMLARAGLPGLTVHDIRRETGWHHGQASAALSNLHKAGRVVRLVEVRDRCKVYVDPAWQVGRESEPYGARLRKAEYEYTIGHADNHAQVLWFSPLRDKARVEEYLALLEGASPETYVLLRRKIQPWEPVSSGNTEEER